VNGRIPERAARLPIEQQMRPLVESFALDLVALIRRAVIDEATQALEVRTGHLDASGDERKPERVQLTLYLVARAFPSTFSFPSSRSSCRTGRSNTASVPNSSQSSSDREPGCFLM